MCFGPDIPPTNVSIPWVDARFDESGSAVVSWIRSDGTRDDLWAARYDVGTASWGSAAPLQSSGTTAPQHVRFARDPDSADLVVWYENDGTVDRIWGNRYNPETSGWEGAALLNDTLENGVPRLAEVSYRRNGDALAVWVDEGVQMDSFKGSSSSWQGATPLSAINDTRPNTSRGVGLDAGGGAAFLIWTSGFAMSTETWASRYSNTASPKWGDPVKVSQNHRAHYPVVAADAYGNAIVAWRSSDSIAAASRYDAASKTWSGPERLNIPTSAELDPEVLKLRFDRSGNAVVVWSSAGIGFPLPDHAYANRYDAALSTWSGQVVVSDDAGGSHPKLTIDASGHTFVVTLAGIVRRYDATNGGWTTAHSLGGGLSVQDIIVDASGHALVIGARTIGGRVRPCVIRYGR
ncbi:MAG: hypothetical protein V3V08_11250 [Nannocystaceae bacterium]